MKQKKAHASHPVGNRTVIGIICIVAALAICFGIASLVNRMSDGKTKIVRLTCDISAGATITEADIEVVDVGSYNLPTGVIKDKAQVVGKCALSSLSKGDYLFPSKIGNDTRSTKQSVSPSVRLRSAFPANSKPEILSEFPSTIRQKTVRIHRRN